jgi:hypothetical protein
MVTQEEQKRYLEEAIRVIEEKIEQDKFIVLTLKGQLGLLKIQNVPKETKEWKKGYTQPTTKKMASEKQIAYFNQHGLGNTEKLTAAEAFKKIRDHKEKKK